MSRLPSLSKLDFRFFSVLLLVLMSGLRSSAQEHTQYDRGTPPQNAAGLSSIGSYSSNDIGVVNLANGGLNIKLPLGQVGGRGFSLPITLNYSSKVWSASRGEDDDNSLDSGPVSRKVVYAAYAEADYSIDYYNRVAPGWTIGAQPLLRARITSIGAVPNSCLSDYKLTKLTLVLPDKGEIELRDDVTDGAPIRVPANSGCSYRDGFRGARWHASDGSGLIFVSDNNNGPVQGYLAGYVITADGTRYRFEDNLAPYQGIGLARCYSITDRNGNQVTISYPNANEVRYTDQLGRVTTVQRGVADPTNPSVTVDLLITFPGYNNQPRYYKVKFGVMSEHYRADVNPTLPVGTGKKDCDIAPHGYYLFPIGTMLFPNSWGKYIQLIDQENVVSKMTLPDGRALNFKYNEYGEVAEVQLPTGGKVQYDYAPSLLPAGNTLNWEKAAFGANVVSDVNDIDRALITRRTYANGSTLESTWSYGYSSSVSAVMVYAGTTNGQLLSFEKQYFLPGSRYLYQQSGDPDGSGYSLWSTGVERRTEVLNASGTVISASEQDWSQRAALAWTTGFTQEQPENDNRVNETRRYLDNGSFAKTVTLYDNVSYPRANNVSEVKEYDYDQTLKRRTVMTYISTNNGYNYQTDDAIHLLGLPETQTVYDGNGNQVARTTTEYDVYTHDGNHDDLIGYASVSQHNVNYGLTKTTRGNATRIGAWLNTTNSYIYRYQRYDIVGNVVGIKDGRGNLSTISFEDDFGDGSIPGSRTQNPATPTYALPTLITSPPPVAGAAVHTARSQYDYWTGQLTGFKDRNNVITQTVYDDPFNRPVLIKAALNTSVEARTRMYYAPATQFGITLANNDVLTTSDQTNVDDKVLRSWAVTDGFGRTVESWKRDPQGDLKVSTVYDALGRVKQTSNPFRPSLESAQYTKTVYDLAGRVTSVSTPDTAVVTTEYSGNMSLITDQQSKKRMSRTNALGQLTQVWEVTPNDATTYPGIQPVSFANQSLYAYQTNYDYNALDGLVRVTQGSQQRFFLYDSLKRLIRARNPEQATLASLNLSDPLTGNSAWSMGYVYDANSNLTQKTDARGVVSTYVYDALNRNTSVDYSDSTPDVFRQYDLAVNGIGRINQTWQSGNTTSATYIDSYDAVGRPLVQRQRYETGGVWSSSYQTTRTYNLAGAVTSQTYPSGNSVTYSYDVAGRTSSFSGNLGDGANRTYSTGILYSPFGGIMNEQFGTNTALYHKSFYNNRGQLFDTRLSSVNDMWDWNRGRLILYYSSNHLWGGSGTDNNGNVLFAETWIPPENATLDQSETLSEQSYEYDALNRLKSVTEQRISVSNGWVWQPQFKQSYNYDRYGNRTIKTAPADTWGTGINNRSFEVEATTNRLYSTGDLALTDANRRIRYDAAGNEFKDTYTGYGNATFDAENRISTIQDNLGGTSTYNYNADGQRTRRKISNQETWQIYGLDGELLAEYAANGATGSPQKEYGYRNGELLISAARPNCGVGYQGTKSWGATNPALGHLVGHQVGSDWVTTVSGDSAGHMSYGPYDSTFGQGHHSAKFLLQVDNTSGSDVVATVDVVTGLGNTILAQRQIRRNEFSAANQWQWFTLEFDNPCFGLVEARVYWHDAVNMKLNQVTITGVNSAAANVQWLITDHLGTPRMIVDQTGTLANTKRHDYLPFGEELLAPAGGRLSQWGYSSGDSIRQQFTQKERDSETGLDYFINRYYSSAQGRFTSADPLLASGDSGNPQTWNRYEYVLNNPIRLVDRYGLDDEDPQDQAKKQPEVVPCKQPKSVTITTGPPQIAAGTKLPKGDYLTGAVSIFSIEVKDSEGTTIKDGVTVQESAVPTDVNGLDLIQNPYPMAPLSNGIVPDYISVGETSEKPLDRNNPQEMEHAGNVIETALSTPITDTVRQTLTVSGCGITFKVVNERTQTNIDAGTGKVRPYKQNGRLVNNYTYSIKAISGPLTVVNKPAK